MKKETCLGVVNTQYPIQMMYHAIVHLKPYNFTNQCHLSKFNRKEKENIKIKYKWSSSSPPPKKARYVGSPIRLGGETDMGHQGWNKGFWLE